MNDLKIAIRSFLLLTVLTGVLYPLFVTAVAQVAMPDAANGSLVVRDGKVLGSRLIGQAFTDPTYFWGRPSATPEAPYNAASSSGSNLGPTNPALRDAIAARIKALKEADPGNDGPIPTDLVTASASGLDPDISVEAAEYQIDRVAKARGIKAEAVSPLVRKHTLQRQIGILGEPRVRVLELNLDLDRLAPPQR
jgi:K+-transporting ATPase ATPase C chain